MARRRRARAGTLTINCGSSDFIDSVLAFCDEQCYDVREDATRKAREAGQKAAMLLRERSRKRKGKGGGAYARDWVADATVSSTGVDVTVHNRRHYMLTHLLEKGHAISNQYGSYGGHVAGDNVIAQVADEVAADFIGRLQR